MKIMKVIIATIILICSGVSYADGTTATTVIPSENLQQNVQIIIDGSVRVGLLTADQSNGLKTWLASNTTPDDAMFIILALTYRSLILNPTQNLKMTATYYKMNNGLTLTMLNLFKVLYQRYDLLPADKMQQLDDVIKQKQAQQLATSGN